MKTYAILTHPYGTFAVADPGTGELPEVFAEKDNGDRHGERLRALVDQANAAGELFGALDNLLRNMRTPITGPAPPIEHVHAWDHARITIAKYRGSA